MVIAWSGGLSGGFISRGLAVAGGVMWVGSGRIIIGITECTLNCCLIDMTERSSAGASLECGVRGNSAGAWEGCKVIAALLVFGLFTVWV